MYNDTCLNKEPHFLWNKTHQKHTRSCASTSPLDKNTVIRSLVMEINCLIKISSLSND